MHVSFDTILFVLSVLDLIIGPFHPWAQGFQVLLFDGGTAPDSDGRRSVTVSTNIKGNAFGFQQGDKLLDLIGIQV